MPDWWPWELELSAHLQRRMLDRRLNETDLREILTHVEELQEASAEGRFLAAGRLNRQRWHVVLEPQFPERIVTVITAYRVE